VSGARDRLAPSKRTYLAGVRHICLPTNHAGLLVDEEVAAVISEILVSPSAASWERPSPAAHRR
jgi:hypothetical protein